MLQTGCACSISKDINDDSKKKKGSHHKQLLTKAKTTGSSNMLRPRKKSHCSVQAPMGITKNRNSLPQNPITDKQRQ